MGTGAMGGGGLSLPASPPPEVLRAIRGGSDACLVMIGGNAIMDVSNSRILQRITAMDAAMDGRGTTMLFVEIPYRGTNRYGFIIIKICHPIFIYVTLILFDL